jgi:hypothetical protein
MLFLDGETCGLCGPAVIFQYAYDDGPVKIHRVWSEKVGTTLDLIEEWVNHKEGLVGFNLAFDIFQIIKIYSLFINLNREWYPDEHIEEIAVLEQPSIHGPCIKFHKCMDLMLWSRKTQFQECMDREDIRIKRVPTALAWVLADELEKRITFREILFARRKVKRKHFEVEDIEDEGKINPNFKNVILRFDASTALKNLSIECGLVTTAIFHDEVALDSSMYPDELGYAPYCTAIGKPGKWNNAWPEKIHAHIRHWGYDEKARKYAAQDVDLTRGLYRYFGNPELGDDDSELAGMVAAVRWKGFSVDIDGMKRLRLDAVKRKGEAPTDPGAARRWIEEVLGEAEKVIMDGSTAKPILEEISKFEEDCPLCTIARKDDCPKCDGKGTIKIEAALRAEAVLEARKADKERELYDKLILANRFHASFKVIGTLSSRMAGADGLNPQGIKRATYVREQFTLNDEGEILCGGDFSSFEVSIAEAVYQDPTLRQELLSGKKLHALLAMELFPGKTYEEIIKSEGTSNDMYDKGKRGVFLIIYGGEAPTMVDKGIAPDLETAENAIKRFIAKHPKVGEARQRIYEMFCSMRQPGGIGTAVEWHEPAPFIESKLGFRRYFTLENRIAKELFLLANDPPKAWRDIKIKVTRRERQQTASGATQSALYGAAFGIQAANLRAAANHEIQSFGAGVTKRVQRKIWDVQPAGIGPWKVRPMNVHDEILCVCDKEVVERVKDIVNETVESFRPVIPLIKMVWKTNMKSWAGKKG